MNKVHYLKTWPEFFEAVLGGQKNFEIRRNDRGFKTGDGVVLQEYEPVAKQFTGRSITFEIGFVLDDKRFGLCSGYCVFTLLQPTGGFMRELWQLLSS